VAKDGRPYGPDELDPLLWYYTEHLLSGSSHQQAVTLLDEFLSTHAERLIADPLKRAMLQRDLWAVFDWLARRPDHHPGQRRSLQRRLAQAIQRLALTPDQIRVLPDNYADAVASKAFATTYDSDRREAFLPPDLFRSDGPWVRIVNNQGLIAPTHVDDFSGRSEFLVFMRLPRGREATIAYLKRLREFPNPWIIKTGRPASTPDPLALHPEPPPFPIGTQLALVRQMMLIDDQSNLASTRLTESVQIRVYRVILERRPPDRGFSDEEVRQSQDVFTFKLSRTKLFAGEAGGLRQVTQDEKEFPIFMSHGLDPFEEPSLERSPERYMGTVLASCANCHSGPGVRSFLSYSQFRFEIPRPPELIESNSVSVGESVHWKQKQYNWGLLQGLWQSNLVKPGR
jgi:hypothetical protein